MTKEDTITWPPPQPRAVDISDVQLSERRGRVYLRYRPNKSHRLWSAAASEDDDDDDYDSASSDSEDAVTSNSQYTEPQLSALQASSPSVFKRCLINIDSSRSIYYARPYDRSYSKILIPARNLCGRAFHGDEVLVEIIDFGKKLDVRGSVAGSVEDKSASSKAVFACMQGPWARVVGVLKRAVDPKYRVFVCRMEEGNAGVMVPLDRGVAKIFNLEMHPTEPGKVAIYGFTDSGKIAFDRYRKVRDVDSVLFVVRYLKWEDRCSLPVGVVVSVLLPGVDVEAAMAILDIEHSVPRRFCEATSAEVMLLRSVELSGLTTAERYDYRGKLVFTIDRPDSADSDSALSFEVLPDGTAYVVGIHVSDVSYFVAKSSDIDSEARQRGAAFHTALGDSRPMLPPRLAQEFCSLVPGGDRLTISVYVKVNASADILGVEIKQSVVRSSCRLSYSQAEAVINGLTTADEYMTASNDEYSLSSGGDLTFAIASLSRVAQLWRSQRVGPRDALYTPVNHSTLDGPKAHRLVDEMMITANHQVALYLLSRFPSCTGLLCQSPPDVGDLEDWRLQSVAAVRHSVVLSRGYCAAGEVCSCADLCECAQSLDPSAAAADDDCIGFEMMLSLWPQIQHALHVYDSDRLQSLVLSPEYHPRQAVALFGYRQIEQQPVYLCSGDQELDDRRHHSLNLSAYVQFTSPLRRYIDLVAHRQLVSALDAGNSTACYTESEMVELCRHCSDVAVRCGRYERASLTAMFCDFLVRRPLTLHAVVDRLSDARIRLLFPTVQTFFPSQPALSLSALSATVIGRRSEHLLVTWSRRIYDCHGVVNRGRGVLEVNPAQYTCVIPTSAWTCLLLASVDDDLDGAADAVDLIAPHVVIREPTSEGSHSTITEHRLRLHIGSVLRVQLSTELYRGLLRPRIQLLHVTPSTCVCLEHARAAVKCFCEAPSTRSVVAACATYSSVSQYKKLWQPVLEMEAAQTAVADQNSVILHNLDKIRWTMHHVDGREAPAYSAVLNLPVSFCQQRSINFEVFDDDEVGVSGGCHGYVCVRYTDVIGPASHMVSAYSQLIGQLVGSLDEPVTWVAHCIVSRVVVTADKLFYVIHLKLRHSSFPFPTQLLDDDDNSSATVEWIDKRQPDRFVSQSCLVPIWSRNWLPGVPNPVPKFITQFQIRVIDSRLGTDYW